MAQKSARSAISVLFGFCLSVVFCFVFFSFKLSTDSHSAGCTQNGVRRDTGSSRFTAVAPPSTLCNILYIYIFVVTEPPYVPVLLCLPVNMLPSILHGFQ